MTLNDTPMKPTLLALTFLSSALTGCASIVSGVSQPISVETKINGEAVAGAACKLSSNKGTWFVTTPGSLTVHRGFQDMVVECSKPGVATSSSNVASNVRALYFGNILFGGIIGLAVDAGDGAGFDYPDLISIDMGRSSGQTLSMVPVAPPASAATAPAAPPAPIMTSAVAPIPAVSTAVIAAPDVAPAPPAMTAAPTRTSYRYMIAAEQFVRERGMCTAKPRATLAATGPGYETYAIACDSGESLIARCHYGHCHTLQ